VGYYSEVVMTFTKKDHQQLTTLLAAKMLEQQFED